MTITSFNSSHQFISRSLPIRFAIIGASKSGTTTLYKYLCRHPHVYMCEPKEPEFFSRDEIYHRGAQWYESLFTDAKSSQLCGEASTTYSWWPHAADAAERIARACPSIKLIYIMRHPVERAYSHYAHDMRGGVTMTFEQALAKSSLYIDCSRYMMQIERYLRFFGRETILCLLLEDLCREPVEVLMRLQSFLGLEYWDLIDSRGMTSNVGMDEYLHRKTTQRLRAIPGVSILADHLSQTAKDRIFNIIKRSPIGRKIASNYQLPKMLPSTRKRLLAEFEEGNRRLAEFLDRDLSQWSV